ncbi:MAG: hypothetical protein MPN21_15330 [Thermoanaerobaculia bacterium]|nr:hypothetical protein [Thermoanaerobaculia bacterium]
MAFEEFLEDGESVLGSWYVYLILELRAGGTFAGHLIATDRYVRFDAQLELGNVKTGRRDNLLLVGSGKHLALPYDQIASCEVKTQFFIMKNLVVTSKSGDSMTFRFGVMSAAKAQEAIDSRLS